MKQLSKSNNTTTEYKDKLVNSRTVAIAVFVVYESSVLSTTF